MQLNSKVLVKLSLSAPHESPVNLNPSDTQTNQQVTVSNIFKATRNIPQSTATLEMR